MPMNVRDSLHYWLEAVDAGRATPAADADMAFIREVQRDLAAIGWAAVLGPDVDSPKTALEAARIGRDALDRQAAFQGRR